MAAGEDWTMRLADYLAPKRIKVPLASTTKDNAIGELIDLLDADGWLSDRDQALAAVLRRERVRSTAIGGGLAIPHGKTAAVRDMVLAVGTSRCGLAFHSIDEKPVHLVILLLTPIEKTGLHVQALARIARLMAAEAVRDSLAAAATAEELYWMLQQKEQLAL